MKKIETLWIFLCCVLCAGCPLPDSPDRPLEVGCSNCPSGTACETVESDAEDSTSIVLCVPLGVDDQDPTQALLEALDGLGGGAQDLSDVESQPLCDSSGCPCTVDAECESELCGIVNGEGACTTSCPEACASMDCPNACSSGKSCVLSDTNVPICWVD